MMPSPSETALSAAYQVTARVFVVEEQLIWHRTALFVALNSVILAGLHYFDKLPTWASSAILLAGAAFGVLWHFSMARAWNYHQYYIQFSRELEAALGLGDLGVFTRGQKVTKPGKHQVGAEEIEFAKTPVRAKHLADATTWLFVIAYAVILVRRF